MFLFSKDLIKISHVVKIRLWKILLAVVELKKMLISLPELPISFVTLVVEEATKPTTAGLEQLEVPKEEAKEEATAKEAEEEVLAEAEAKVEEISPLVEEEEEKAKKKGI